MRLLVMILLAIGYLCSFPVKAQNESDCLLIAVFDSTARVSVDSLKMTFPDSTKRWRLGGQVSAIASQSGFFNWASGGEPSLSFNTKSNVYTIYRKDSVIWLNDLDMSFGMLKKGGQKAKKNDDLIEFISKYNRKTRNSQFQYTALIMAQSQLFKGYSGLGDSTLVSGFLSPIYVLSSLGFDYLPLPKTRITIAPLTGKLTLVVDDEIASLESFFNTIFSINKYMRYEFGGFVKLESEGNIIGDLSYKTRLGLFSNYARKPQNIDIDWQTQLIFKLTRHISLNLRTHLVYDDDVNILTGTGVNGENIYGPRLQLKEIAGAGFLWKF